jgi:hypothetical protein
VLQLQEKRKGVEGLSRPVTEILMENELKEELVRERGMLAMERRLGGNEER